MRNESARQKTNGPFRYVPRTAFGLMLGLTLTVPCILGWVAYRTWKQLPEVAHLAQYRPAMPLRIWSRDGTLLAEYGSERREFVPIGQIPLRMKNALLATEDARFYEHGAVDFGGLARSALANLIAGQHAQGGSTISMQVARGFYLTREKTYDRKLTEILMAYKLESAFGKDRLLELYMNQIYLGQRAYGFAAGAAIYFGKTLDQLTLAEAAMLAGLPKAPSAYNPVANLERATQRQHYILRRMREIGLVTSSEYGSAINEKLVLAPMADSASLEAGYIAERARRLVVDQYQDEAYTMGLDVITTVAIHVQRAAESELRRGLLDAQALRGYRGPEAVIPVTDTNDPGRALAPYPDFRAGPEGPALRAALVAAYGKGRLEAVLRDGTAITLSGEALRLADSAATPGQERGARFPRGAVIRVQEAARGKANRPTAGSPYYCLVQRPGMEGALISLDAGTGDILALVGGFDFTRNKFDHALQAYRQPGSSFKPFVYSAALEKGYFPGTLVDDTQRVLEPSETGARRWQPRNYGNQYEGFIPVRRGLMRSKNLVAVSLMQASGATYVQQFAQRFGFENARNPPSLPLALGAGAATPLQLAQAYAVFANDGRRTEPRLIARISQRGGRVLYQAPERPVSVQVIPARNAFVMDSMLRDVVKSGTGRGAAVLGRADAAGKTGTSNQAFDAWFAGYSSGVVTVVWLGYDEPRSLGNVTGGTLALPVWTRYMRVALEGRAEVARPMPDDLAVAGGDYVYREYLDGTCLREMPRFIRSSYTCANANAQGALLPVGENRPTQSVPAPIDVAERARVLQLFQNAQDQ